MCANRRAAKSCSVKGDFLKVVTWSKFHFCGNTLQGGRWVSGDSRKVAVTGQGSLWLLEKSKRWWHRNICVAQASCGICPLRAAAGCDIHVTSMVSSAVKILCTSTATSMYFNSTFLREEGRTRALFSFCLRECPAPDEDHLQWTSVPWSRATNKSCRGCFLRRGSSSTPHHAASCWQSKMLFSCRARDKVVTEPL